MILLVTANVEKEKRGIHIEIICKLIISQIYKYKFSLKKLKN